MALRLFNEMACKVLKQPAYICSTMLTVLYQAGQVDVADKVRNQILLLRIHSIILDECG